MKKKRLRNLLIWFLYKMNVDVTWLSHKFKLSRSRIYQIVWHQDK